MSGKGGAGGNNGRGNTGISGIPAGSRKVVQSLKEIVNYPEAEIYAMLKDCNMDPNEAVGRLLAQDTFHEVKSKREKKKENRETTESKSRGASNTTHRGSRGGADRYSRGVSTQFSSNESGMYGKPAYKKENGANIHTGSSSSAYSMTGINVYQQPPVNSELPAAENKMAAVGASDAVSYLSQPPGLQSPWLGAPGQVSMADIVKMGRPHYKASSVPPNLSVNNRHHTVPPAVTPSHDYHLPENYAAKVSDFNEDPEVVSGHYVHSNDEWPSIEQPPASSVPSALEEPEESADQSNLQSDRLNQHIKSQLDEGQAADEDHETIDANHVGSTSVSSRNIHEDESTTTSHLDGSLYGNVGSYQSHKHAFEQDAEDGASSVAANLQQLNIQDDDDDDQEASSEEENPSVIIPDHLQVHAQECAHLSFGSFGGGINSGLSGTYASRPLTSNLEESSEVVDATSAGHSDARNTEYYGDEHLRNTGDENLMHRAAAMSPGNYESPAMPQQEVLKEEILEAAQGNQYAFPPSAPGYAYDNSQQLNSAFGVQQTSSQMQNISQFTSIMQDYTNSLPSALLSSTVQPGREPDLPYSPFPVAQPSMPTKYSNSTSLSGPSISMPEALRAASISTTQPTQQSVPGANVPTGPALPPHLTVHPYSQPTLPLGPFANMIGYPFLPQSYTYLPSAFQQTFAGNNTYPQSLAAVLPQYKNSVSVSSLPQSAPVASGYGFGSSTSIPAAGNFPLNPPTAPAGTSIGYDDVLSSQFKDPNHLISLQQNDNSGMWVHGPGSRTMSAVPGSTYYSFQGQNQQPGGFRQGQQPSQHFGALGYPNYYHSQSGISLEHQQQNARDATLGGSQAQPSKQTQQLWQNGY